jgi:hypothetical protein
MRKNAMYFIVFTTIGSSSLYHLIVSAPGAVIAQISLMSFPGKKQ